MKKRGFTLIELLIVIAIIGIIAAIAIPNLLTALQKGKQKSTMGDLKSMGTAVESYITDWMIAPDDANITDLATHLQPFHIKNMPRQDGWRTEFQYGTPGGANGDIYTIASAGRRGVYDGHAQASRAYVCTSMGDFENDIVFSNGQFTVYPRVQ